MPDATRFVIGRGKEQIFRHEYFVNLGVVSSVSEHAFVGNQIPFLDCVIGRASKDVGLRHGYTGDVVFMASKVAKNKIGPHYFRVSQY